jgi:hypothetical protein
LNDDEKEKVKSIFEKNMTEEKLVEYFENYIKNSKNEKRLIAWHNIAIKDDNGKIIGTLSSGEDITAKKERDKDLKRRTEESEKFAKLAVGRELRMVELKKRIKKLEETIEKHGIDLAKVDDNKTKNEKPEELSRIK